LELLQWWCGDGKCHGDHLDWPWSYSVGINCRICDYYCQSKLNVGDFWCHRRKLNLDSEE
jgi:hypothetical protein